MNSKQICSLINGFQKFLERNTGLTTNSETEHYVLNPDYVLSNNRHNISKTSMEGQPNGDATTEGQSLLILGWLHCYIGSNRKRRYVFRILGRRNFTRFRFIFATSKFYKLKRFWILEKHFSVI